MEVGDLCERLEAFGLDAGEARLYFHLSRIGPSRASDLAEQAGVHRTDVYRMAESLVRKGFVEKTLERPVRFVPQSVQSVLEKLAESEEERLRQMRENAAKLVLEWPNQATAWGNGQQRFAVHQGRTHIQALFQRMIENATEEIVMVMSRRGLAALGVGKTFSLLDRKAREGVSVRILTRIDAANVAELRQIATTCEVRHVDLSGYHQMLVVDYKEIALFVASSSPGAHASTSDDTVLWLNSQDFVMAQKVLVDRSWKQGIGHREMSWALSHQTLAPHVETVRGELMVLSTMKQMLSRGQHATLLLPWPVRQAWGKLGLNRTIQARRRAGAHIRVIVHGEVPQSIGEDMHILAAAPFPVVITEDESLMIRVAPDQESDTWAIHATLPDVVQWTRAQIEPLIDEVMHVTS